MTGRRGGMLARLRQAWIFERLCSVANHDSLFFRDRGNSTVASAVLASHARRSRVSMAPGATIRSSVGQTLPTIYETPPRSLKTGSNSMLLCSPNAITILLLLFARRSWNRQ